MAKAIIGWRERLTNFPSMVGGWASAIASMFCLLLGSNRLADADFYTGGFLVATGLLILILPKIMKDRKMMAGFFIAFLIIASIFSFFGGGSQVMVVGILAVFVAMAMSGISSAFSKFRFTSSDPISGIADGIFLALFLLVIVGSFIAPFYFMFSTQHEIMKAKEKISFGEEEITGAWMDMATKIAKMIVPGEEWGIAVENPVLTISKKALSIIGITITSNEITGNKLMIFFTLIFFLVLGLAYSSSFEQINYESLIKAGISKRSLLRSIIYAGEQINKWRKKEKEGEEENRR